MSIAYILPQAVRRDNCRGHIFFARSYTAQIPEKGENRQYLSFYNLNNFPSSAYQNDPSDMRAVAENARFHGKITLRAGRLRE
jgi:hypothetical protein